METSPTNSPKLTLQIDQPSDDKFWSAKRKLLAFLLTAAVLILLAKACGGTQRTEMPQAQFPLASGSDVHDANAYLKDLQAKEQALKDAQARLANPPAPSVGDLTVQQQRAAYGPQQVPQKKTPKETTGVINYEPVSEAKPSSELGSLPPPAKGVEAQTSATAGNIEEEKAEQEKLAAMLSSSTGEKYRIRQGTLLPCTQMLRINGAYDGGINCLISFPIFSTNGGRLLIPAGTMALGKVKKVASQNQERLFVSFDKLIMPDGYTFTMKDAADGMDQIGQTGLRDKVNHHYGQIFGAGLALALVGGLSEIGNVGGSFSAASQYRSGFTEQMSQNSMQILARFANVLPTFTIREGARNQIYLPGDFWLPDYANHTMKGNM
jgi:type IV secretory pathway VirB10-like protein